MKYQLILVFIQCQFWCSYVKYPLAQWSQHRDFSLTPGGLRAADDFVVVVLN